MKITKKTRTRDILPLLTKENLEEVLKDVPEVPLKKPILSLTVREFGEIVSDEEGYILGLVRGNRSALRFLGRLKSYRKAMDSLNRFIKTFDVEQTAEEKAAAKGVLFPNFQQRMLLTCAKFFGYKSLEEAGGCKLADYLTIFQDEASAMLFQRRHAKILEQKYKAKNKRK